MKRLINKIGLALALISTGVFTAYSFDSDNMVESALEFGHVNIDYFMSHFQDGNVLALTIGIVCVILLIIFNKHIPSKLMTVFKLFVGVFLFMPLFGMIKGMSMVSVGQFLFAFCLAGIFTGCLAIISFVFILPCYVVRTIAECGNLRQSVKCAGLKFIQWFGPIPIAISLALVALNVADSDSGLLLFDVYVYFPLAVVLVFLVLWESNHLLQWGNERESKRDKVIYVEDSLVRDSVYAVEEDVLSQDSDNVIDKYNRIHRGK